MVLFLRDVGFTLAEAKALLASRSVAPNEWRRLADRKLADIDEQIQRTAVARLALQHALRCKHEDIFDCPNFTGLLAAHLQGKSLQEAHPH